MILYVPALQLHARSRVRHSFFPETLRSLVGDGTIPPPLLNCTPAALLRRKRELREMEHRGEEVEATRSHRAKVGVRVT